MSRGGVDKRRRRRWAGAAGLEELAGAGGPAGGDEDEVVGRTRWSARDNQDGAGPRATMIALDLTL